MSRRPARIADRELVVQHTLIGHGVHQFTCWWTEYQGPVGVVWCHLWGSRAGTTALVLQSFVPDSLRRRGIRSFINREILRQAARIVTSDWSSKAGHRFMGASGYSLDKEAGLMVLRAGAGPKPGRKGGSKP